jgi:hypothetical protein
MVKKKDNAESVGISVIVFSPSIELHGVTSHVHVILIIIQLVNGLNILFNLSSFTILLMR